MAQQVFTESFPNGLTLVAERMDWLESAAFTLAIPSGSVNDPFERLGLANFTAEMVLRGCGDRNSREFIEALDRLGADRSTAVSSAHTSFSLSTVANVLEPALEIYADLVRRPHIPADQMEDGRLVCQLELQSLEDDLAQKTMLRLRQEAYSDPWGRSSLGTAESLQRISRGDIVGFHGRHYSPQSALLGVAGKIEWGRLRDMVENLFGDWSGEPPSAIPLGQVSPTNVHIQFQSNQTQVSVAFESIPFRHPDYIQARAAVGVLSDGMSSRLFTKVREERGLCYTVYAHHHSLRDAGRVFCFAGTSTERAQETLDVLLEELHRLTLGITEDELARLKARTKSALILQQESSAARSASLVGDWYHLGRIRTMAEIQQLIDGVTCTSVGTFLKQHPPRDFTVVTLGQYPLEVRGGVSSPCVG